MQGATKRIFVSTGVAFLVASSAMITTGPLDLSGGLCTVTGLQGEGCQSVVRIAVIALALAFKGLLDWYEIAYPLRRLVNIQKRFVEQDLLPIVEVYRKRLKAKPGALRTNIMVPRWRPWGRVFEFLHPDGFKPPVDGDRDIVLRAWQGVAGAAFYSPARRPVTWYFDDEWNAANGLRPPMKRPPLFAWLPFLRRWTKTAWGLTERQAEKTHHVKWILSVQMFREEGRADKPNSVRGVINIDITDAEVAKRMMASSPDVVESLTGEIMEVGLLAAELW